MFNSEFKETYIECALERNVNARSVLNNIFLMTEPLEEKLNKDCSCFSLNEIISFYKSLCSPSLGYLMNINSQLNNYGMYALNNNIQNDRQNHYYEINTEMLSQCVNAGLVDIKICSREKLNEIINSQACVNAVDKFILLALFEGICGKECIELLSLTMDDFDEKKLEVDLKPSGRKLTISKQLYNYALESSETYIYYADGYIKFEYEPEDKHIIKKLSRNIYPNNSKVIFLKIAKINSKLGTGITSKSLLESGRIDLINRIMSLEENKGKTCDEVIRKHHEVNYRYNPINRNWTVYVKKYGSFFNGEA